MCLCICLYVYICSISDLNQFFKKIDFVMEYKILLYKFFRKSLTNFSCFFIMTEYLVDKLPNPNYAGTNCIYLKSKSLDYIQIVFGQKSGIFKVLEDTTLESDKIYLNTLQRTWLNVSLGTKVKTNLISNGIVESISQITFVVKNISAKTNPLVEITDETSNQIANVLEGVIVNPELNLTYLSKLTLIPINMKPNELNNKITSNTQIKLISTDKTIHIETSDTKELFKANFNFNEMGIGGLDKEFEVVFRRAFSSRLIPDKVLKDLGINHVRGLMLYGLPGCGKSLIARQIGKILNCEEPKIVSGPSLLSSYQGQSEKNVRDLFEEAFADKRGKKLYLIILDEFDAIARKRGTIHDAGLSDRIVNQFLSMIDGPESLNNILLIAMTNRLELIDDALLRPGRFEVQIEIGLPDEKGRHDILTIHTNKMNNAGYMRDVNLQEIASKTKNFTGAELESVVKNAVSYCIAKEIDPSNLASIKDIKPIITQTELLKSANEIKPQFGTISREIEIITSDIFELYSNDYKKIYDDMLNKISTLAKGNLLSMLIQGDSYVGKTTLACQVAKNCGLNCVKFISSETLMSYAFKETQLYEIFEQGCRSESFVLVLDCVEKLIEYSKLGNIYNNKILQTIYTILAKIVEPSKSIVVILTSSNKQLSANIDLPIMCNYTYQIFDGAYPSTLSKQVSVYFKEKKFTEC